MKKSFIKSIAVIISLIITTPACKKDKDKDDDKKKDEYHLTIKNGAQSVPQGKAITFSAVLIDKNGVEVNPSSVTWSSSNGGSGSFSGAVFNATGDDPTVITAKTSYNGVEYTASVPLAIVGPNSIFTVVPSAIIWTTDGGPIDLTPVYVGFGTASTTYTYSSDKPSVASVNSSGTVSFLSTGNANITVTGNINGQTAIFVVPVLVVGEPTAPLPVARVVVSPGSYEMFRGETKQFTAKAYNSSGADVTSTVTFTWSVASKDPEFPNPVSINSTGLVTVNDIGDAFVYATAKGISGQAEVAVIPDSVLWVDPFYVSLGGYDMITGQPNPTSQVFTASAYKINRTKYRANDPNFFDAIPLPSNLKWELPLTGIPQVDAMFEVVTLSNATNSSVRATAIDNKFGSTVLFVGSTTQPGLEGAALINVGF
jgi:hypothetical protein